MMKARKQVLKLTDKEVALVRICLDRSLLFHMKMRPYASDEGYDEDALRHKQKADEVGTLVEKIGKRLK